MLSNLHVGHGEFQLGKFLLDKGELGEAEPLLRSGYQILRMVRPGDKNLVPDAESAWGRCLLGLRRYREAEPLLVETYPVIRDYRGPDHRRTLETREALIWVSEALGEGGSRGGADPRSARARPLTYSFAPAARSWAATWSWPFSRASRSAVLPAWFGALRSAPDYNQIMYRLALDDPRLFLPLPVYRTKDGEYMLREAVEGRRLWNEIQDVPFFALARDRRTKYTIPLGGFYALPPGLGPDLNGKWTCKIVDREGPEAGEYDGELEVDGEWVTGRMGGARVTRGSIQGGAAKLEAGDDEGGRYVLTGGTHGEKLAGQWRRIGAAEEGSWECAHATAPLYSPAALLNLYRYRTAGGQFVYSTTARAPSDVPIARVWRNPMSLLILDRDVKPGAIPRR